MPPPMIRRPTTTPPMILAVLLAAFLFHLDMEGTQGCPRAASHPASASHQVATVRRRFQRRDSIAGDGRCCHLEVEFTHHCFLLLVQFVQEENVLAAREGCRDGKQGRKCGGRKRRLELRHNFRTRLFPAMFARAASSSRGYGSAGEQVSSPLRARACRPPPEWFCPRRRNRHPSLVITPPAPSTRGISAATSQA